MALSLEQSSSIDTPNSTRLVGANGNKQLDKEGPFKLGHRTCHHFVINRFAPHPPELDYF